MELRCRMRCLSSGRHASRFPHSDQDPISFRVPAHGNGYRRQLCGDGLRPAAVPLDDGRMQAPHMLVLVFARGLLRHLISRVYFERRARQYERIRCCWKFRQSVEPP